MSELTNSNEPENRAEPLEPGERLSASVGSEGRRSKPDDTDLSRARIEEPVRYDFDPLSTNVASILRKSEQS